MRPLGLFVISMFAVLAFTVPAQAAPVCGNSVVESGEDCDDGNTSDGDCCSSTCQYEPTTTECRAASGVCDAPDNCDGAGTCTADAKLTSECRASVGVCDVAEVCDGVANDCPADAFEPATTECRAAAGVCDPAWFCDGVSPDCYPIVYAQPILCRASTGPCDPEERCVEIGPDCPPDILSPAGTECRAQAGICDIAEVCDGASAGCPPDEKLTTVCRPAAHVCDAPEFCDGVSDDCPIMDLPANGLPCPDGDPCNGDEICVGWVCTPGQPLVCDDEWVCTADSCDPELGCVYEPILGPGCVDRWLPSASPTGRLLLSLLLVAAGATFLARS